MWDQYLMDSRVLQNYLMKTMKGFVWLLKGDCVAHECDRNWFTPMSSSHLYTSHSCKKRFLFWFIFTIVRKGLVVNMTWLVQMIASASDAKSHKLNHCWWRSMMLNGVICHGDLNEVTWPMYECVNIYQYWSQSHIVRGVWSKSHLLRVFKFQPLLQMIKSCRYFDYLRSLVIKNWLSLASNLLTARVKPTNPTMLINLKRDINNKLPRAISGWRNQCTPLITKPIDVAIWAAVLARSMFMLQKVIINV